MINNDRKKRIEEFLLKLSRINFSDNNSLYKKETVYSILTDLGVGEKTYDKEELANNFYAKNCRENHIENNFKFWINRFYNRRNTSCFVAENWKYFCQFKSKNLEAYSKLEYSTHIKLYIPLDSKHIKEGANQIFDFLDYNHIPHISKIGKYVRFDDIVVRLFNERDARNLIKFVSDNTYIQEGLIKANPFLYSENGIAMAYDGNLSCNSCLSKIICEYINTKRKMLGYNCGTPISYEDFYDFMLYMYNEIFNKDNQGEYTVNMFLDSGDDLEKSKISLKGIFENLLCCKENEYDISTYFEMFNKQRELYNKQNKLSDIEIENLIIKAILILTQRFNSESLAYNNIFGYITTGNLRYITNQQGLRHDFANLSFDECCRDFIARKGTNVENYLSILKNKLHEDYNILIKENYETNLEYLEFLKDYYSRALINSGKTSKK